MRPYGPNCSFICFPCMMEQPEREVAAAKQFTIQLEACGDTTIIGEPTGPRPIHTTKRGLQ